MTDFGIYSKKRRNTLLFNVILFEEKETMNTNQDYAIELSLKKLSPELYKRYKDCFVVSGKMLTRYENYFPDFTDHSLLHVMDILEYCNKILSSELEKMSAEELYVLMMGALFHDVGMGISFSDFDSFMKELGLPVPTDPIDRAWAVRRNHHELSGLFLKKYAPIFEIPNEKYRDAIIQVCRGHRKTDLWDEKEYPSDYEVEEGKKVNLPYLAALIRLSDELDISQDRNISFLYDVENMPSERDRDEFHKHMAVYSVEIEEKRVVVRAKADDEKIIEGVKEVADELYNKLIYCSEVAAKRSPYRITQSEVALIFDKAEGVTENE